MPETRSVMVSVSLINILGGLLKDVSFYFFCMPKHFRWAFLCLGSTTRYPDTTPNQGHHWRTWVPQTVLWFNQYAHRSAHIQRIRASGSLSSAMGCGTLLWRYKDHHGHGCVAMSDTGNGQQGNLDALDRLQLYPAFDVRGSDWIQ